MPLVLNGKKYNGVTLTGDRALETYAENTPPPADVQSGRVYFANGEKHVGTGKAFEKAGYGSGEVQLLFDEKGNEKYGLSIFSKTAPNIIFLVPMTAGDISLQTEYTVDLANANVCEIGVNHTASGKIFAFFEQNRLKIYLENIENKKTKFYYFYGKDNKI